MNADEKARFDGFRIAEMLDEVRKLSADAPVLSRPEQRRRLLELLRALTVGLGRMEEGR